jgi:hypothetical protein
MSFEEANLFNVTDYVGGDLGERRLAQRFPAVADTEEVT